MVSTIMWSKTRFIPISRHIYNAECLLLMSAEAVQAHASRKSKRLIHVSRSQENKKFMNTMSQFSRTDNLLFKDRSFSCTLDLIDLVKQIQSFQKGWTLKPDVSVKQSKMFKFWILRSIISYKSVTCQTEIQSLSILAILVSIMKITAARKWKLTKTISRLSRKDSLPLSSEGWEK